MTTTTVPAITAVRLSCNHSITGTDILGLSAAALEQGVGAKVECTKCPPRKVTGATPTRRIKTIVEDTVPAPWTPTATDTGTVHGPEAPAVEVIDTVGNVAAGTVVAFDVMAARDEHRALKAWTDGGHQGDRPDTTNLDAMNAAHAAGQPRPRRRAAGPRRQAMAQGLRFYHDDKPMPDSQNKISSVAWYYTRNVNGDLPRVSTSILMDMLAKAGIDNPKATEWTMDLPNGVTLAAKFDN